MIDIPTKEEIQQLYEKKGSDFLIWYIWRNAVRVLPLFGLVPLLKLESSEGKLVRELYQAFQVSFLLFRWQDNRGATKTILANKFRDIYSAGEVIQRELSNYQEIRKGISGYKSIPEQVAMGESTVASYVDTAIGNAVEINTEVARFMREDTSIVDLAFLVSELAQRAEWSANAAIAGKEVVDRKSFDESFDNVFNIAMRYTDTSRDQSSLSALSASARFDFDTLVLSGRIPWFETPLWSSDFIEQHNNYQVDEICQWADSLSRYLGGHGYDYIAQDVARLLSNKQLGDHSKKYTEVYSSSILEDPKLLKEQLFGDEIGVVTPAVRVLLIGAGGAGKSTLADRLKGNPVEHVKQSTPGIDYYQHKPLDLGLLLPEYQNVRNEPTLYLWDFGGQAIFHGLHSAFLGENCIYVIVVDSRHEQAPDEWLQQIYDLAGSKAVVLVITNEYENCKVRQNEARLLREYQFLEKNSFFYFSCMDVEAEDFSSTVLALIKASQDSQRIVPQGTLQIKDILSHEFESKVFISIDEIERVIHRFCDDNEDIGNISQRLEQLGFIARVNSNEMEYCIQPSWIVDHAYKVLNSKLLIERNGLITLRELSQSFKDDIAEPNIKYLIAFLEERSLCTRLKNGASYFFPDASRSDEVPKAGEILRREGCLAIRFDLPYFPLGLHARLIHSLFLPNNDVCIHDVEDIWRQGFVLRKNEISAVVHYLTKKSVIELVFSSELNDFLGSEVADILNTFYINLKAVVSLGSSLGAENIEPFVILKEDVFSVHNASQLVKILKKIRNYEQLIDEVSTMASKTTNNNVTVNGGQVSVDGKNIQMTQIVDEQRVEISVDQRQQVVNLIDDLLNESSQLTGSEIVAVGKAKEALDSPEPDSKNRILQVAEVINDFSGFAKDKGIPIAKFLLENKEKLAAAFGT